MNVLLSRHLLTISLFALLASSRPATAAPGEAIVRKPVEVKLVASGEGFELTRDGQPYFVRGVGGSGSRALLARVGGNTVRTWGTENLEETLDDCHRRGLTVAVGIWLGHERHGFNYNDADQVARQQEMVRRTILQYKDHPAVLLWGLGNEMEGYGAGDNAAVWLAVNQLAALAKGLDPHHPTMTVVAEIGGDRVKNLHRLCPEIDIVGINSYAGAGTLPQRYRKAGGTKPYLLTEFGPAGSWETTKNAWGAPPEPTSTAKADHYRRSYQQAVMGAPGLCLGSFAFLWGQKQEASATWFGMLLPDGSRLAAVDAMQQLWTGQPPENRAPAIESLRIENLTEAESGKLAPGSSLTLRLVANDAEQDPLRVEWILQADPLVQGVGGDAESAPPTFPAAIVKADLQQAELRMPAAGGGYRLFAVVRDNHGGAAVANVPLRVDAPIVIPPATRPELPLVLYDEAARTDLPYVPAGYMGNHQALKMEVDCQERPRAGETCVKLTYSASDAWAGIVWQSPANDWGDRPGGWDLSNAKRLTFWARGAAGGEVASFQLGLLGADKKYPDSGRAKLEKVTLSDQWQSYSIPLAGQDLTRIKTGFALVLAGQGKPVTFYLDDIRYEP